MSRQRIPWYQRASMIAFVPLAVIGAIGGFIAGCVMAGAALGWGWAEEILGLGAMQGGRGRQS